MSDGDLLGKTIDTVGGQVIMIFLSLKISNKIFTFVGFILLLALTGSEYMSSARL
jgi:hypothetical protein